MSQSSFSSLDSALLIRDAQGRYLPTTTDQILDAARQAVDQKMVRGTAFTSPVVVKEYLTAKLAGFDVEVFAVLFLDSRHRLIEYVEMFQGTPNQASVYPRGGFAGAGQRDGLQALQDVELVQRTDGVAANSGKDTQFQLSGDLLAIAVAPFLDVCGMGVPFAADDLEGGQRVASRFVPRLSFHLPRVFAQAQMEAVLLSHGAGGGQRHDGGIRRDSMG